MLFLWPPAYRWEWRNTLQVGKVDMEMMMMMMVVVVELTCKASS